MANHTSLISEKSLINLQDSKSPGFDIIWHKLVKNSAVVIIAPIAYLYNASFCLHSVCLINEKLQSLFFF
jgi:hypothetical protein